MNFWAIGIILFLGMNCQADIGSKQPLAADFQSLITNSGQEKSQIESRIQKSLKNKPNAAGEDDKGRVIDFVDVEIGWGKNPPVVDRRFDSVGTPTYDQKQTP